MDRFSGVTGPLFELFRWEHLREEGAVFPTDEIDKVGDTYYRESADSQLHVVQLKWATGEGKKVLASNLRKALKQLKGLVSGNSEGAPEGSKSIARIGLQNRSFEDALDQITDLLKQFEFNDDIQVDLFDVPDAKKHTVEVSGGVVTIRSTDCYFATKEALPVWRTITWAEMLCEAAEKEGHKQFAEQVTQLSVRFA